MPHYTKQLDFDDFLADQIHLRSLERAADIAREGEIAVQTALYAHPVVKYVKECPVEEFSSLHPAISDSDLRLPSRTIVWTLPGRDDSGESCGFRFSRVEDMRFTACTRDRNHFIKAAKIHCWRLACSNCVNDAALKKAQFLEKQVRAFADYCRQTNRSVPRLKHWVFSPPQDWAAGVVTDPELFPKLRTWVQMVMLEAGFLGGILVFHPWRLQGGRWVVGPHFHIVGYGFVDDRSIFKRYGCVVKQVHAGQEVRSLGLTIAYLLTHTGIGCAERDEDSIDFDMSILNHFVPGVSSGDDSGFLDGDWSDYLEGRGRMCGDLEGFDWERWTEKRYTQTFNSYVTFGVASRKHLRVFDIYREVKVRRCPVCDSELAIYSGFYDRCPEVSQFVRETRIFCYDTDFERVMAVWLANKSELEKEGYDVMDFAVAVPLLICSQKSGGFDYDPEAYQSRAMKADRQIRYFPSRYGTGYDPVLLTRAEAELWDKARLMPVSAKISMRPDSIRVSHPDSGVWGPGSVSGS